MGEKPCREGKGCESGIRPGGGEYFSDMREDIGEEFRSLTGIGLCKEPHQLPGDSEAVEGPAAYVGQGKEGVCGQGHYGKPSQPADAPQPAADPEEQRSFESRHKENEEQLHEGAEFEIWSPRHVGHGSCGKQRQSEPPSPRMRERRISSGDYRLDLI